MASSAADTGPQNGSETTITPPPPATTKSTTETNKSVILNASTPAPGNPPSQANGRAASTGNGGGDQNTTEKNKQKRHPSTTSGHPSRKRRGNNNNNGRGAYHGPHGGRNSHGHGGRHGPQGFGGPHHGHGHGPPPQPNDMYMRHNGYRGPGGRGHPPGGRFRDWRMGNAMNGPGPGGRGQGPPHGHGFRNNHNRGMNMNHNGPMRPGTGPGGRHPGGRGGPGPGRNGHVPPPPPHHRRHNNMSMGHGIGPSAAPGNNNMGMNMNVNMNQGMNMNMSQNNMDIGPPMQQQHGGPGGPMNMHQFGGRGGPPPPPPRQGPGQGPNYFHPQPQQRSPNQPFHQGHHPHPQPYHAGPRQQQQLPSYQMQQAQAMPQASGAVQPNMNIQMNANALTNPIQQQRHSVIPASNVATTVASPDPNNVAANWSIHKAPNGVDYFYNSVTTQSTYERPSCLGPDPTASPATASVTGVNTKSKDNRRGWTQHLDQASGKIYYYNGVTTTWEKPHDFNEALGGASTTPAASSSATAITEGPPSKKRKKKSEETIILYSNKAEAVAAFKGLLLAKDISPTMKWNEVVKACSDDKRWEACSTMGERKQALAEYQTKRANKLREEKRQEKIRAKDAFMSLLTDVLPSVSTFQVSSSSSPSTIFQDIRESISKDDRFYAVEDETSREELYLDFVEEIRKREERKRRGRKREAKDAFLAFLKTKEECGTLTFASTYPLFLSALDERDKVDPRFAVSTAMKDSDRELYFVDYVIELQKVEDGKRRRAREARRRAEKAQRDAFRDTLKKFAREGKILPTSRWRNCEELLAAEDTFDAVRDQDRATPRNMFEDMVEEWEDVYRGDKAFLNSLLAKSKSSAFAAKTDAKYEDFTKVILDAAAYSPEMYSDARRVINEEVLVSSVCSAKLFFDEWVASGKSISGRGSRNTPYGRRGVTGESSEDEGEIVEDGEVEEPQPEISKDQSIRTTTDGTEDDLQLPEPASKPISDSPTEDS